ncbi:unnamed protein product [Acanthosepion pharaonis]|uniref:Uncharacterized protein n=1 Tax=Acanthosepion pharaonis TaxID=158019 RepID=A0A812ENB2_ACAPH|nr:unnamed protein product [Sepia pharaonis]
MFQHRLVVRYTQLSRVVSRRHIYPSEHQPICIRPSSPSRQSSRLRDRISISSTHRNGGVSFFGPITALHARHKRTLLCRELSSEQLSVASCSSSQCGPGHRTYNIRPHYGGWALKRSIITGVDCAAATTGSLTSELSFITVQTMGRNGLAWHRLLPETLLSLTTATIQLQQLHRSLHSNVPTPPRSSLHTTLSSGLPPSHLSQRTPTNLHTPKFSSRQSSRLRDRISIMCADLCRTWKKRSVRVTTISGETRRCCGVGAVNIRTRTGNSTLKSGWSILRAAHTGALS